MSWERREKPARDQSGTTPLFSVGEYPSPRFPGSYPKGKNWEWEERAGRKMDIPIVFLEWVCYF